MLKKFKNFKGEHSLAFRADLVPVRVLLSDVQVGDTFMREGAVCMRLQDTVLNQQFRNEIVEKNIVIILNMQTANVWPASGTDLVDMADCELVIKKIHKAEC